MTVDKSPAWVALETHAKTARFDLSKLAENKAREGRLVHTLDGAVFDFSKNLIDDQTLDLLIALARQQDLKKNLGDMLDGKKVNVTEDRPAHHTALRADDAPVEVLDALARVKKISGAIRADKNIKDIIHIGIGGSDLGPRLVCFALPATGPKIHFVANADPADLNAAIAQCDPKNTAIIVVSKTFTTHETLMNLKAARAWLGDDSRIIAVTSNDKAAKSSGIKTENILPIWDWVGGRFSIWSPAGISIAISASFDTFEQFLAGARRADSHVAMSPLDKNIPVLMALLTIWYRNFLGCTSRAVVPYAHALKYVPAYLQQLEMESNGKRIDRDGHLCAYATSPIVFGMEGPNAQHAFMQMIHQGTDIIPCDFIGLTDGDAVLMANMQAQAQALMTGRTMPEAYASAPGNRPSTTIILPRLDPAALGLLLAIHEHKTAALGFLWNINSFDQFGVEFGKALAKERLAR